MNPNSLENLKKGKPYKEGEERARTNGSKGGQSFKQKMSQRKTLAEMATMMLANPMPEGRAKDQLRNMGFDDKDLNFQAAVVAGIVNAAAKGSSKAADKVEEWCNIQQTQGLSEQEKALSLMRENYLRNVNSNFGQLSFNVLKHRYTHFDVSGGRGSTKSSWASLTVVRLVMENPDIHALVMRKVANTLRDSVYTQYMWAIGQLGVADYWDAKKNPLELIYKPTGQRIMFRGADDPMKIKSIKVPFGYIAVTHFEEKDQYKGREEIRNILQSTMRGGELYWNIETYNPPISRDNWANKDTTEDRGDRFCHKSTFLDLDDPSWLGEQFMLEAEHLKETNYRNYQHEYLGIPVGTGGNVFENLEIRTISDAEIKRFDKIYQGVDYGWFPDPYAFVRLHYDAARETIYFIDEHFVNKETNEVTGKWILDHGYNDTFITCDSAEPKSVADYRSMGLNAKEAVKGPGSVDYGMKWIQKRKIVIDKDRTPNIYREFTEYEYEKDRYENWISGYPDSNNHSIDATRYALERVFNKFGNRA